ncbi:MAG: pilus assembly protein [Hyphomicrobiales bacterium]|nr:pilus assembly protein [Hyphomicrobiales bacterium]
MFRATSHQTAVRKNGVFRLLRRFRKDNRGISAVEFALILPIMVTLYLGVVEFSQVINADRRATSAASAAADLVAQISLMNDEEMRNVFDAASAIMAPYDPAPLALVVSSVRIDDDGNALVAWSCGHQTSARPEDSSVTLPAALAVPGSNLIMSEVTYERASIVNGYFDAASYTLSDTTYFRPRVSNFVAFDPNDSC